MKKRALVISGGGSKGAFAVGVLKELYQMYPLLDFDYYVGSSTGSLVVSLASVGKMDTLQKMYTTVTDRDIYIRGNIIDRVNDVAIFDSTPLWNLINKNFTDEMYEMLLTSAKKVFFTTVCLQTNELNVFSNNIQSVSPSDYRLVQTINANYFRRAMLASCSQPVFMQPVKVGKGIPGAKHPEFQYVDGGVLEYVGIQMAIDSGATDILVILLTPEDSQEVKTEFKDLMSILGETIDILVSEVGKSDLKLVENYNAALKYIDAVKDKMLRAGVSKSEVDAYFSLADDNIFQGKRQINIIKIRPSQPLGGGPGGLHFDPDEMKAMMATGKIIFNDVASSGVFDRFLV